MVSLRVRTWLHRQNRLLRGTSIRMRQCGLVVGLHWISTEFQPADPPSRLDTVANSSPLHALRLAQVRWLHVRTRVPEPDLLGVVWLRRDQGEGYRSWFRSCVVACVNSCLPLFLWADNSSQPPLYLYCSFAKILFPAPPPIRRHSHYAPRRHSTMLPSAAPEGACGCPLALGGRAVANAGAAYALHLLLAAGTHRLLAWPCSVCRATPRFGVCALRLPHAAPGAASAIGPPLGGLCCSSGDGPAATGVHRPDSPWSGRQLGRGSCGLAGPVYGRSAADRCAHVILIFLSGEGRPQPGSGRCPWATLRVARPDPNGALAFALCLRSAVGYFCDAALTLFEACG